MEKEKALEAALLHIEKQFGKGSVMKLGQHVKTAIPVIPTGCLSLDMALGVGGCREDGLWKSLARNRPARPR